MLLVGAPAKLERALQRAGFSVVAVPDRASAINHIAGADLLVQATRIPPGLSEREQQLVVLSALGMTQQGIAQVLQIAKGTIKSLRRRLSEKLWNNRHGMRPRGSRGPRKTNASGEAAE